MEAKPVTFHFEGALSTAGHPAGNLRETREEKLSEYSVATLSAVQISCHVGVEETAEDWRVVISSE